MIRILQLEDDPCDAELVEYELAKLSSPFEIERVYDVASYRRALETAPPDVIVADHRIPAFGGQDALRIAKQVAPGVPFILVTGTLDDETAVAYLKAGAVNYILKDHLARLPSAVEAALVEAERERQLQWQRSLLAAVLSAAPSPLWVQDAEGRLLLANEAVGKAFAVPPERLANVTESALGLPVAEVAERARRRREALAGDESTIAAEEPITDTAGETRWFQVVRKPLRLGGKDDLVLTVATDFSERRRLVEAIPDAFLMVGPDDRVERTNLAAETLFVCSREDLVGRPIAELLSEATSRDAGAAVAAGFGDPVVKAFDGSEIAVEIHRNRVELSGGTRHLLVIRDLRQRRSLERQLQLASRLESVGRLAGGVAHDFNNLLTVILAQAEMLLARGEAAGEPADDLRGGLTEIIDTARRGGALTRQLLAFSRKQVLQPRLIDVDAIVAGMRGMLQRVLGEDVALDIDLAADHGVTRADPGQIEQVVMNLAVNSRDAMPRGGRLTLATAAVILGEEEARPRQPMPPGDYLRLSVIDDGVGMDEETAARAFDPFFTTKGDAGTGLGLASVYGIVKQSGGFVWIDSAPRRGTRVDVFLPRLSGRADAPAPPKPPPPPSGGPETILLVEDETRLRQLVRRGLERYGYRILEAETCAEARQRSTGHEGPIDLLLTDVVLPDGTGSELATALRRERPEMTTLFTSGYAGEALADQLDLDLELHFLQKPYTGAVLARRVRDVLDATAEERRVGAEGDRAG